MRFGFLFAMLFPGAAIAMQAPPAPTVPPNELVREVVNHEIKLENADHTHWMYRAATKAPMPEKTKTVVQTDKGDIDYLNDVNGHPLSKRAERRRPPNRALHQRSERTAQSPP